MDLAKLWHNHVTNFCLPCKVSNALMRFAKIRVRALVNATSRALQQCTRDPILSECVTLSEPNQDHAIGRYGNTKTAACIVFSLAHIIQEFPLNALALRRLGAAIGAGAMKMAHRTAAATPSSPAK